MQKNENRYRRAERLEKFSSMPILFTMVPGAVIAAPFVVSGMLLRNPELKLGGPVAAGLWISGLGVMLAGLTVSLMGIAIAAVRGRIEDKAWANEYAIKEQIALYNEEHDDQIDYE